MDQGAKETKVKDQGRLRTRTQGGLWSRLMVKYQGGGGYGQGPKEAMVKRGYGPREPRRD